MIFTGKNLWQIGAGDTERSYGEICIKFDVMLAGPGSLGEFDETKYVSLGDIRHSLRRFCKEARKGDIVLLRLGTGSVLAVGEIADDAPQWLDAFEDVDGWDLQHVRRVRWFPSTANTFPKRTFGGQVRTFASVDVPIVRSWVTSLSVPSTALSRNLSALPSAGASLDLSELAKRLFIEGLPSEQVDKLTATFASLQRIASWYWNETKRPEGRPSEHETVAYLVVPLLLSLGWSQQTVAIEWNKVDLALFRSMPPENSTLACVVEAKLLGRSVFSPLGQARDYAVTPGRGNCDRLIITDGIRYALYRRSGKDFSLKAYLNIIDIRASYPVYQCAGAVEALLGIAR